MASLVLEEFESRQDDIDRLIELAQFLDDAEIISKKDCDSGNEDQIEIDDRMKSIMNSLIQLASYNQIESTMRGCLESLYDNIDDRSVSYDKLTNCIQKNIIKSIINGGKSTESLHSNLGQEIAQKIPKSSLNIRKIFNGNVSKETITKIKKDYEIEIIAPLGTRDGVEITLLKDARNDLAHGNKSFSEHGRKYSLEEVINVCNRTNNYLRATISSFDDYIEQEKYLRP